MFKDWFSLHPGASFNGLGSGSVIDGVFCYAPLSLGRQPVRGVVLCDAGLLPETRAHF